MDQSFVVQLFYGLLAQALNVECLALYEVLYATLYLRRAVQDVGTVKRHLRIVAHQLGVAGRAMVYVLEWNRVGWALA